MLKRTWNNSPVGFPVKFFTIISLCTLLLAGCAEQQTNAGEYVFVQMGDPQIGMSNYTGDLARFSRAVSVINNLQPQFVLICGDMVDKASEQSFNDFNSARGALSVPSYCIPGNHDIGYQPDAASLELYRTNFGDDYFVFTYEGDSFVCANTQLWKKKVPEESEKHDRWFADALTAAAAESRNVFVVLHYPFFVAKPDEKEHTFNLPIEKRKELLAVCSSNNVSAVLAGHAHRAFTNEYNGIQLVNSETTSINIDKKPFGFRLWRVGRESLRHEFVPVK